jgi:hypothetical protein
MATLFSIPGCANSSINTIKDVVTRKHRTDISMDDSTSITPTLEDTFTRKHLRTNSQMSIDDSVPIFITIRNSKTTFTTAVEELSTRNRHKTGSEDSIDDPTAFPTMEFDFTTNKRIRTGSEESTATSIEEIEKGIEEDIEEDEATTLVKFGGLGLEDEAEDEVMYDTSSSFDETLSGESWVKEGYWSDASSAMELDNEHEVTKKIKDNGAIEKILQLIIDEAQSRININNTSTQGYLNGQARPKYNRTRTQHQAPSPQARNKKNNIHHKNQPKKYRQEYNGNNRTTRGQRGCVDRHFVAWKRQQHLGANQAFE